MILDSTGLTKEDFDLLGRQVVDTAKTIVEELFRSKGEKFASAVMYAVSDVSTVEAMAMFAKDNDSSFIGMLRNKVSDQLAEYLAHYVVFHDLDGFEVADQARRITKTLGDIVKTFRANKELAEKTVKQAAEAGVGGSHG